jgi:hypothetical protein
MADASHGLKERDKIWGEDGEGRAIQMFSSVSLHLTPREK